MEMKSVVLLKTLINFQNSIGMGMGFTFDDSNPDTTPITEMQRL